MNCFAVLILLVVVNCIEAWSKSRTVERLSSKHSISIANKGNALFASVKKDLWPLSRPSRVVGTFIDDLSSTMKNLLSEISTVFNRVLDVFIVSFTNKKRNESNALVENTSPQLQQKVTTDTVFDTRNNVAKSSYAAAKPKFVVRDGRKSAMQQSIAMPSWTPEPTIKSTSQLGHGSRHREQLEARKNSPFIEQLAGITHDLSIMVLLVY